MSFKFAFGVIFAYLFTNQNHNISLCQIPFLKSEMQLGYLRP